MKSIDSPTGNLPPPPKLSLLCGTLLEMYTWHNAVMSKKIKLDWADFELIMFSHRVTITKAIELVKKYMSKMDKSHPAYSEFEQMYSDLIQAHFMENIFDRELAVSRQRAADLEMKNDDLRAEIAELKKRNDQLISML
jgi:hypothetical protein